MLEHLKRYAKLYLLTLVVITAPWLNYVLENPYDTTLTRATYDFFHIPYQIHGAE